MTDREVTIVITAGDVVKPELVQKINRLMTKQSFIDCFSMSLDRYGRKPINLCSNTHER